MLSRGLLLRVYWEFKKEGNNNNSDCMSFKLYSSQKIVAILQ